MRFRIQRLQNSQVQSWIRFHAFNVISALYAVKMGFESQLAKIAATQARDALEARPSFSPSLLASRM